MHGYLSLQNNKVVVASGDICDALRFYPVVNAQTGQYEFHTYPIGIIDHVIGLVGEPDSGFYGLRDIVPPANGRIVAGGDNIVSWTEFTLTAPAGAKDDSEMAVSFVNATASKWYAFPRGAPQNWEVNWWDGEC